MVDLFPSYWCFVVFVFFFFFLIQGFRIIVVQLIKSFSLWFSFVSCFISLSLSYAQENIFFSETFVVLPFKFRAANMCMVCGNTDFLLLLCASPTDAVPCSKNDFLSPRLVFPWLYSLSILCLQLLLFESVKCVTLPLICLLKNWTPPTTPQEPPQEKAVPTELS